MKRKRLIIPIEIIALIILYMFVNSEYIGILPSCWIYDLTGMLCPACGGTRCIIYILNGKWREAFFSNMIFFIGVLYVFIINLVYIINLNRKKKIATWIYPKYWYAIIFTIFLIIYTIVRNLL